MRAKRKADYHHGRLRQTLIETAVKAIAQRGVDALSLRELAARAGVSPGAPYHHFPNRSDLLASIAEEGFTRLEAQLTAARDAAPDNASARLEALGLAYVAFALSSLGYFRVMFHGGSTSIGPTEAGLRTFNILRDAVVACQQAGEAPRGDPAGLVLVAWSAVHGFATLRVDRALPFEGLEPERLAPEIGRLITRMFSALAACPACPRGRSRRKLAARPKCARNQSGLARRAAIATRAAREDPMAESVYKVVELVGTSTESWEKAAAAAVERASKSLRDLRVAEVVEQDLVIEKGKVEAYRTKLKVSFKYEGKD
jgi:flavin-binding protein dodecin/AcrR family transcriptional regulator